MRAPGIDIDPGAEQRVAEAGVRRRSGSRGQARRPARSPPAHRCGSAGRSRRPRRSPPAGRSRPMGSIAAPGADHRARMHAGTGGGHGMEQRGDPAQATYGSAVTIAAAPAGTRDAMSGMHDHRAGAGGGQRRRRTSGCRGSSPRPAPAVCSGATPRQHQPPRRRLARRRVSHRSERERTGALEEPRIAGDFGPVGHICFSVIVIELGVSSSRGVHYQQFSYDRAVVAHSMAGLPPSSCAAGTSAAGRMRSSRPAISVAPNCRHSSRASELRLHRVAGRTVTASTGAGWPEQPPSRPAWRARRPAASGPAPKHLRAGSSPRAGSC